LTLEHTNSYVFYGMNVRQQLLVTSPKEIYPNLARAHEKQSNISYTSSLLSYLLEKNFLTSTYVPRAQ
jgi:hypothetical protein